jgi:spectinomycin phosphotransferase
VIVEPPDLPAHRVLDQVRANWDSSSASVEFLPVRTRSFHWVVSDAQGPRWFAIVDALDSSEERLRRIDAYAAASVLAQKLDFVVAPVADRAGRMALMLSPGYLLSVAPFSAGTALDEHGVVDEDRAAVAGLLARLHAAPRPQRLRTWKPSVGWRGDAQRGDLVRVVERDDWVAGPLSEPAGRLLNQARGAMASALTRFDLLVAAVRGAADRWVPTHGEPHGGNVLRSPDGHRLVDWRTVSFAPRERDLRVVLRVDVARARGASVDLAGETAGAHAVMQAYADAGGRPGRLSPDTFELFDLEERLSNIAASAVRLAGPHDGSDDDERSLAMLERELAGLPGDRV